MARRRIDTRLVRRILSLFTGVAIAGYASSAVSRRNAELATANRIVAELGTGEVFVTDGFPDGDAASSADILARTGFAVHRCRPGGGVFACFPWASIQRARVRGPFVVDVTWAVESGGLSGHGMRTYYLGLLGLVIHVRDIDRWVS
jgi:hypothetical protein